MNNLTICIPTHTVKTETRGIYRGVHNGVPSAPSTKMLETVLDNLNNTTNIDIQNVKIIVGFDKRNNREIDNEYYKNILSLSSKYNLEVSLNESDVDDPIETAPNNFLKLIDKVTTEYYLFWEHDWLFNKEIDIVSILNEMESNKKINYVKFNQFTNTNDQYDQFISQNDGVSENIDVIPTHRWSNNPYICRTEIFQKWWKNFIYPTEEEGGFVEGPMNVFFTFYSTKIGWEEANKKFGCYVYGKWRDPPIVSHLNGNSWR